MDTGSGQVVESLTESRIDDWKDAHEEVLASLIRTAFSGFKSETLENFLTKNQKKYSIDPDLNPEGHLICLTEEESSHIFRDDNGWDRFMREYPKSNGLIRMSRVGFDENLTQAMIYIGHTHYWNVGTGRYYVLSRSREGWIVEGNLMIWIS